MKYHGTLEHSPFDAPISALYVATSVLSPVISFNAVIPAVGAVILVPSAEFPAISATAVLIYSADV